MNVTTSGTRLGMVLACLLLLATGVRCSGKARPYTCPTIDREAPGDIDAEWDCNRDVMRRAKRGKKFSMREFEGASAFFEGLTGIAADTSQTHLGDLPGPDLEQDLAAWDAWYVDHRDRLYRDEATGELRVRDGD